jgi:hypothetical protein
LKKVDKRYCHVSLVILCVTGSNLKEKINKGGGWVWGVGEIVVPRPSALALLTVRRFYISHSVLLLVLCRHRGLVHNTASNICFNAITNRVDVYRYRLESTNASSICFYALINRVDVYHDRLESINDTKTPSQQKLLQITSSNDYCK